MPAGVRVGVIGTNWFADVMHLPSLKSHAGAKVVSICGRNRDRAEQVAHKFEIRRVFTDYQEMINTGDLDALVIATPDDLHYAMAMAGLNAGLHVLCEKPLAYNGTQAREMYEKAESTCVKTMAYFTYRWLPQFRTVKELVTQGYIGRPYHASFDYFGGYGRRARYTWRFDGRRANGILGDLGSHMIDLARWLVGDMTQVSAPLDNFIERPGCDGQPNVQANDSAVLLVQFANGAQGTIHASAVAHVAEHGQEEHVRLYGEQGSLECDVVFSGVEEIRGAQEGDRQFRVIPVPEHIAGTANLDKVWDVFDKQPAGDRAFIDAIIEDRPLSPAFAMATRFSR